MKAAFATKYKHKSVIILRDIVVYNCTDGGVYLCLGHVGRGDYIHFTCSVNFAQGTIHYETLYTTTVQLHQRRCSFGKGTVQHAK